MTPVKWGILSTADINRLVIPGAHASPKVELVGVASRDGARAEAYAREAITLLESLPVSPELASAYSNRAQLHMLAAQTDEAIFWGSRAIELAHVGVLPILQVVTVLDERVELGEIRRLTLRMRVIEHALGRIRVAMEVVLIRFFNSVDRILGRLIDLDVLQHLLRRRHVLEALRPRL